MTPPDRPGEIAENRPPAKTILTVAYPFAAVGPAAVGGAEQVLATLEAALVRHGFQSVVAAHADSRVAGHLHPVPVPTGILSDPVRSLVETRMQAAIDHALRTHAVDLIHMHGIDFHRYTLPPNLPVLVTLHLPPAWYPEHIWNLPPNFHLQCVSESQRAACPPGAQGRLSMVPNGVPPSPAPIDTAASSAPTRPRPRGRYALLLSRICPEKNLHTAIDAARIAGIPIILAGQVYPYPDHLAYFKQEIQPRLGPHARFIGPVGGPAKTRLLQRARCLLMPSIAPETSSLVAMEALAAGTPVIAFRSGALPEIVDHGQTGFLVNTAAEMSAALLRLPHLPPGLCRLTAQRRFSARAMVAGYLDLYARCTPPAARRTA